MSGKRLSNSQYFIASGTWKVDEVASPGLVLPADTDGVLTDGDMEAGPGLEKTTDGDMSNPGSWTLQAGSSIAGGLMVVDGTQGGAQNNYQNASLVIGKTYQVQFTVSGYVSGSLQPYCSSTGAGTSVSADGTYNEDVVASGAGSNFLLVYDATFEGNIDDVSVKETAPDWTPGNDGLVTKETSGPQGGSQWMKIEYNGAGNPYVRQSILTVGETYRATGWFKSDGTRIPKAYNLAGTVFTDDTSPTEWTYFDSTFVAVNASVYFQEATGGAEGWIGFDDVQIYKVQPDSKCIECVSAGIIYRRNESAYGTWEFDLYKDGGSAVYVNFIADRIGGTNIPIGYALVIGASEELYIRRNVGGGHVNVFSTAINYIEHSTWYDYRITRRYDGLFTLYIKGGSFTDWALVDSDTDNTYTVSSYCNTDIDAGDRIRFDSQHLGVLSPV